MNKKIQKTEKFSDLLSRIKYCLEKDEYKFTTHALERRNERIIEIPDILHVLRTGCHEKSKDAWDIKYRTWNYSKRENNRK